MVTRLIFLFLLSPLMIFAGEFTASVNRNQVRLGESLTLNLTLKNASAKEAPQVQEVKKIFVINSQQHTSNTVISNGQVTASIIWKLTLIPQKEGDLTIPPVSVMTSEGVLLTQPIAIKVVKNSPADNPASADENGIQLKTMVSNLEPYKNEPLIYTVKLSTQQTIANIKINKIEMEDVIFEPHGEPSVREEIVDGIKGAVVEFTYLVTPLKAGPLKIPSTVVQGVIPVKKKSRFGSFFDDEEMNPFSAMGAFDQLKPFVNMTDEMTLEVRPAVAEINPWLPAKALKIEEVWEESQALKVGEPLNRKFTMIAEGVLSNQLPSLNTQLTSDNLFKVYADKPEFNDQIKEGSIKSFREEQYTLIPQQPGTLTLPEMSVTWWDTKKHEKMVAVVPSKTVQILPATENLTNEPIALGPTIIHADFQSQNEEQFGTLFYGVIGGLVALLLGAISWGIVLQKKISRLTKVPVIQVPAPVKSVSKHDLKPVEKMSNSKKEKLPDLNPT